MTWPWQEEKKNLHWIEERRWNHTFGVVWYPQSRQKKSTNRGNVHFKGRKGWCLRLNRGHKRMYMFFWFNYNVQVLIHFFSGFTYNQFLVKKNNFLDSLQYASKPYFFRCFFFIQCTLQYTEHISVFYTPKSQFFNTYMYLQCYIINNVEFD